LTVENGNGELRQLLEVKRAYRADLAAFEADLKARYEQELADAKKRFKEQYLELIVDVVFAETIPMAPTEEPAPTPEPASSAAPAEVKPSCPECGSSISPSDKFCPQCACPLKEDVKDETPVVSTGSKFSVRVRS